jgi:tetratricopeptide (TPR) repeat protein
VATWGYDKETTEKYETLRKKGEMQIKARQYENAVKTWEQIVKLRPVDSLPHQRLAGLYLSKEVNQPQKAIEQLILLDQVEIKDNRYAKRIARLYRDAKQLPPAISYATKAVYTSPYDLEAHQLLADLLEISGNDSPALQKEKRIIPILTAWIERNKPQ